MTIKEQIFSKIEQEPDIELDFHNGYIYRINRHNQMLHYCGYVYVPMSHPLLKKVKPEQSWYIDEYVSMHGGCTYCSEVADYLVIGFDCGHAGDITPSMLKFDIIQAPGDEYRDYNYMKNEIYSIIEQLIEINTKRLQKKYETIVESEYAKMWLIEF